MQRIDHPTNNPTIETQSDYTPTTPAYFTVGNPSLGDEATEVTSTWLNGVQEELAYVIETGGGLTLSVSDNAQLYTAIQTMIAAVSVELPPNFITGLEVSNNTTDSAHDLDITVGSARDDTDSADINLSTALTKQIDANWVAGTGAGGLDTSTVAADTTYYVFAISKADGTSDVLISASETNPTMPTDYIYRRLLTIIQTDSSSDIIAGRFTVKHADWGYFQSETFGWTSAAALTIPHLLGRAPREVQPFAVFNTVVGGYAVGDEIMLNNAYSDSGTANRGMSVLPDATNLSIKLGSSGMSVIRQDNGGALSVTTSVGNFDVGFRAWY